MCQQVMAAASCMTGCYPYSSMLFGQWPGYADHSTNPCGDECLYGLLNRLCICNVGGHSP